MTKSYSAVIPLYNKERHIRKSLLSAVLALKGFRHEIIVIDDGSTDYGPALIQDIKENNSNIRLMRQENKGVSAARNKGVELSSYNYILFLDADDEWTSSFIRIIDQLISNYPNACLFGAAYLNVFSNRSIAYPAYRTNINNPRGGIINRYWRAISKGPSPICSSSCCVKKQCFLKVGGFPENVRHGEDKILWSRLATVGDVVWSPSVGAKRYRNAENRSGNTFDGSNATAYLDELQRIMDAGCNGANVRDIKEAVLNEERYLIKRFLDIGDKGKAKIHLQNFINNSVNWKKNLLMRLLCLSPRFLYALILWVRNFVRRI
jgi:glycosyltransferase involved in cell wall biosynthesis